MVEFGWCRSKNQRDSFLVFAKSGRHVARAYVPYRFLATCSNPREYLQGLRQKLELEVLRELEAEFLQAVKPLGGDVHES